MTSPHTYNFKIYNGRVKVYIDGVVMFSFTQIDLVGYYAYINDNSVFGIDIYLLREKAGESKMGITFDRKDHWLAILKLLDENL